METTKESLVGMGFDPELADKAIAKTKGSIDQAIDWLDAHPDGAESESDSEPVQRSADNESEITGDQEPKASVEDRLSELRVRAAERKAAKAKEDAIERRKNEEILKKSQTVTREANRELELKQAKKQTEQKRRAAIEDRKYREKLRMQIEQDKREREARNKPSAAAASTSATSPAPIAQVNPAASKSASSEVRIRLRYQDKTLVRTFGPTVTVAEMGTELKQELGIISSFVLATTYPVRKIEVDGNYQSLREAGLANSSVNVELV